MSDSLPPNGDPGPYDGWDLEGLLSGDNVWLPERMRPVASALAALRSAPARTELSSEAAARAAFRDIMGVGAAAPAQSHAGAGDANTLILPARASDGGPHVVARPRHSHRRPPRRGRWGSKALLGGLGLRIGAAAVVIVGGIALAGTFSGSGAHPEQPRPGASSTSAAPLTSHPGSNRVEGTASTVPSPTPSHTSDQQSSTGSAAASGPSQLCRHYLGFISDPGRFDQADESGDFQQLSELAGGPWHIIGYCMRLQPWAMMPNGDESDAGGPGFPPGSQGSVGGGGSRGDKIGQQGGNAGNSGNGVGGDNGGGNAGNGDQPGANDASHGNQDQH